MSSKHYANFIGIARYETITSLKWTGFITQIFHKLSLTKDFSTLHKGSTRNHLGLTK